MQLGRKDFLKVFGAGTGAALLYGATSQNRELQASSAFIPSKGAKAMLYDASKCVGCRACQNACKRWNRCPPEPRGYGNLYDNPSHLSAKTWTLIQAKKTRLDSREEQLVCKYQCMHCTEAACVKVCPTHALQHHELGFVSYNPDKCSGCGYCTEFCPFHVPRLSGNQLTGQERMQKCTFCENRVVKGLLPACVDACPAGALLFEDRDELVKEGKNRVNSLNKTYPNATFYGENELGGLHVMYVLKDSPETYILPADPRMPAEAIAWKDVIQPLGWAVGGLTILGLGLNYLVAREAKRARELPGREKEE